MKKLICYGVILLLLGCSRKFDIPPPQPEVDLLGNISIRDLKAQHLSGNFEKVESDLIIEGTVVANDQSGNFYQSVILQDASGGIVLKLAQNNLYAAYPVGRKLYVKAKGLYLGDYGGTIQLGGGIDSSLSYRSQLAGIASGLIDNFIVKGSFNNPVDAKVVPASQLTDALQDTLQSTLIQLENYQFGNDDLSQTLADTSRQSSAVSFVLQNCTGTSVILRNSSYASFAAAHVPQGNGNITGIFTVYNGDKQLAIRDTSDIQFNQVRCQQQLADTNRLSTIKALRSLFTGRTMIVPYGTVIKATVISDSKNESNGNYKIQDASGRGIILYGTALPILELGKTYLLDLGGATLEIFSNELEITNLSASKIYTSSNQTIAPRSTNIAQIMDSLETFASTLIRLNNVYISAPVVSSSGRTYTIMDNTGSMETFIRSAAGFSLQPGNAKSLVAYVSLYQGKGQLALRTRDDVNYDGSIAVEPVSFTAEYTFRNVTTVSGRTDPGPQPTVAGISFGAFRSVGLGANPSASGRFSFTGWPVGANSNNNDFTGTEDASKYYEVTITPDQNAQLILNTLEFVMQRSATGPRQWFVRSSLDGFSQNLAAVSNNSNIRVTGDNRFQIVDRSITNATSGCRVDLGSDYSGLRNSITFRLYALNAESAQGSFSLNSFRVDGKVE